jgi:hypothetical protein
MSNWLTRRSLRRAIWLSTLVVLALVSGAWLSGCGGSSPTDPGGDTFLSVELTDAPTDEVSEVVVCIVGLTVKHTDRAVERISHQTVEIDLLQLRNVTRLLVRAGVEAGSYEFIQIELDETCSSVVEIATGERKELQIPSRQIKVLGGFSVAQGRDTRLVLDFDADQSLVKRGNGEWLLKPVIVVDRVSDS